MRLIIHGIAGCDACRKARRALPAAQFRDIRADPLSDAEIDAVLARFGDGAINRASTTWRNLSQDARKQSPGSLLAAHPTLLKRPLIRAGNSWYLGWKADTRAALGVG